MPLLTINTNTAIDDKPATLAAASQLIASQLGKPESFVMVNIVDDLDMLFAGSSAPLAHLQLKSLGLHSEQTAELSATLCDWVSTQLAIPTERIYIEFAAPERAFWGWNRSTFGS
ncbi:MAG: phenylpyruvate tautomerase MIF-related protein [Mariprofundales bacterium]|nr:phenylpyruvate tautomerase MIF-related protein [Mariprofundales bacterium]